MHGGQLYASMSDSEEGDERFQDEMGARDEKIVRPKSRSPNRKSSNAESGEDSDARRKSRSSKSKRKSKRPSGMNEDEKRSSSSRRSRDSARMEAEAAGLVVPPGAPAGRISSPDLSEDPRPSRRSRQSATHGAQSMTRSRGVEEAVNLTDYDDEDPFNRPPPQDQDRSRPSSATKKKQEINKDFKDVHETGRWGSMSKKEMWIVGIVGVLVIIGVVVAVVVLTTGGDDNPAPASANSAGVPPPAPTAAPTARVVLTAQQQLAAIRGATIDNPTTQSSVQLLPEDVSFYEGKANDPTAAPVVRAASWVMYDDPIDNEEWLVVRYALAVLYYSTSGDGWTTRGGWLNETNACDWHGMRCDRFNKAVEEIDLSGNNLNGTIPNEVNMVSSLISLWLRRNNLSKNVPNVALGAIPHLSILYLDDNALTGMITPDLAASESLKTLFVHGNNLTGVLPYEFCPQRGGVGGLLEFGIDCDKLECFCCEPENCF